MQQYIYANTGNLNTVPLPRNSQGSIVYPRLAFNPQPNIAFNPQPNIAFTNNQPIQVQINDHFRNGVQQQPSRDTIARLQEQFAKLEPTTTDSRPYLQMASQERRTQPPENSQHRQQDLTQHCSSERDSKTPGNASQIKNQPTYVHSSSSPTSEQVRQSHLILGDLTLQDHEQDSSCVSMASHSDKPAFKNPLNFNNARVVEATQQLPAVSTEIKNSVPEQNGTYNNLNSSQFNPRNTSQRATSTLSIGSIRPYTFGIEMERKSQDLMQLMERYDNTVKLQRAEQQKQADAQNQNIITKMQQQFQQKLISMQEKSSDDNQNDQKKASLQSEEQEVQQFCDELINLRNEVFSLLKKYQKLLAASKTEPQQQQNSQNTNVTSRTRVRREIERDASVIQETYSRLLQKYVVSNKINSKNNQDQEKQQERGREISVMRKLIEEFLEKFHPNNLQKSTPTVQTQQKIEKLEEIKNNGLQQSQQESQNLKHKRSTSLQPQNQAQQNNQRLQEQYQDLEEAGNRNQAKISENNQEDQQQVNYKLQEIPSLSLFQISTYSNNNRDTLNTDKQTADSSKQNQQNAQEEQKNNQLNNMQGPHARTNSGLSQQSSIFVNEEAVSDISIFPTLSSPKEFPHIYSSVPSFLATSQSNISVAQQIMRATALLETIDEENSQQPSTLFPVSTARQTFLLQDHRSQGSIESKNMGNQHHNNAIEIERRLIEKYSQPMRNSEYFNSLTPYAQNQHQVVASPSYVYSSPITQKSTYAQSQLATPSTASQRYACPICEQVIPEDVFQDHIGLCLQRKKILQNSPLIHPVSQNNFQKNDQNFIPRQPANRTDGESYFYETEDPVYVLGQLDRKIQAILQTMHTILQRQKLPLTQNILSAAITDLKQILYSKDISVVKKVLHRIEKSIQNLQYDSSSSLNIYLYLKGVVRIIEEKDSFLEKTQLLNDISHINKVDNSVWEPRFPATVQAVVPENFIATNNNYYYQNNGLQRPQNVLADLHQEGGGELLRTSVTGSNNSSQRSSASSRRYKPIFQSLSQSQQQQQQPLSSPRNNGKDSIQHTADNVQGRLIAQKPGHNSYDNQWKQMPSSQQLFQQANSTTQNILKTEQDLSLRNSQQPSSQSFKHEYTPLRGTQNESQRPALAYLESAAQEDKMKFYNVAKQIKDQLPQHHRGRQMLISEMYRMTVEQTVAPQRWPDFISSLLNRC